MSGPLAVLLAGILYGVIAFAVCLAVGEGDVALVRARESQAIDGYRVKLMCVTIGCAAIGCFTTTRGLTLEQSAVSAVVVAALAGAVMGQRTAAPRALAVIAVPLFIVVCSAAFDAMWSAVTSALLAALPFALTALLVRNRSSSLINAAVAALAGASIGITSAFFVLFAACLCALALRGAGRGSLATLQLAPYIAALTLVGILLNMSVLV